MQISICILVLLEVGKISQNGLACTMLIRLDFSSKFTSLTLMLTLGLVTMLVVEGTEKSRRVFLAIGLGANGA
jgi:hypothetical protein